MSAEAPSCGAIRGLRNSLVLTAAFVGLGYFGGLPCVAILAALIVYVATCS